MIPLEDVSMLAVATMLIYITLSVFTILNVVTGVFVNTAIERASADKEIASLKTLQKRNEQMQALQSVFEEMNQERGSDQLKVEDIEAAVNVDKLDSVLESLGISTDDVKTLFSLIDTDGSGAIDLQEFVSGCMQLHGPARSMQLAKMGYENKRIAASLKKLLSQVKDMQRKMNAIISVRTAVPITAVPAHEDVMYI
ncbi:cac [Symbiodinium pilosum]|uniref:Cac protein n=1 Tax=Symbiodinium pilosum TaxID=2952 RepID=A0A812RJU2_SYMPI|nr:cac [Symbiodinium pilosum]